MASTTTQLREGDIVVHNGRESAISYGSAYFYVVDPDRDGWNSSKARLIQITDWSQKRLGLEKNALEVVGHVDPLELDHHVLPLDKKELLSQWIGQR